MIWVPMMARYRSKCNFCDEHINQGELIRFTKQKYWAVHNRCWQKKYGRRI